MISSRCRRVKIIWLIHLAVYTTQAYERERLPINAAWGAAIDFIGRTFGVQTSAIAVPRGLVLSFLNAATPLKQQIILAASGEGGHHLQNLEELK